MRTVTADTGQELAVLLQDDGDTVDSDGLSVSRDTLEEGGQRSLQADADDGHTVTGTDEVLYIREGKIVCHIYDHDGEQAATLEAAAGDILVLRAGGHGIEVLEETDMVEVKQGPYPGDDSKVEL